MNRADERKPAPAKPQVAKKPAAKKTGAAGYKVPESPRSGRNPRAKAGFSLTQKQTEKKTRKKMVSSSSFQFEVRKGAPIITAAALLGVKGAGVLTPLTSMDMASMSRRGVSSSTVDKITDFMDITQKELSNVLAIPERTLVRRKGAEMLPSDESGKLVRMARVIERAEGVFEDQDAARDWLKSANTSLSGETPMSMLDTEFGAEAVMDTLGRIEHGVFA